MRARDIATPLGVGLIGRTLGSEPRWWKFESSAPSVGWWWVMWDRPRVKHVCIPCRLVLRYAERCPRCRGSLEWVYDFQAPRKSDDRGWKKIEIEALVRDSNIMMCTWGCCVPHRGPKIKDLTLSQYKARVRKSRTHRQGGVPQYSSFKGYGI